MGEEEKTRKQRKEETIIQQIIQILKILDDGNLSENKAKQKNIFCLLGIFILCLK